MEQTVACIREFVIECQKGVGSDDPVSLAEGVVSPKVVPTYEYYDLLYVMRMKLLALDLYTSYE